MFAASDEELIEAARGQMERLERLADKLVAAATERRRASRVFDPSLAEDRSTD